MNTIFPFSEYRKSRRFFLVVNTLIHGVTTQKTVISTVTIPHQSLNSHPFTHFNLVSLLRMVKLYLLSSIHLHGVVLN
jgi:hypothetical protein